MKDVSIILRGVFEASANQRPSFPSELSIQAPFTDQLRKLSGSTLYSVWLFDSNFHHSVRTILTDYKGYLLKRSLHLPCDDLSSLFPRLISPLFHETLRLFSETEMVALTRYFEAQDVEDPREAFSVLISQIPILNVDSVSSMLSCLGETNLEAQYMILSTVHRHRRHFDQEVFQYCTKMIERSKAIHFNCEQLLHLDSKLKTLSSPRQDVKAKSVTIVKHRFDRGSSLGSMAYENSLDLMISSMGQVASLASLFHALLEHLSKNNNVGGKPSESSEHRDDMRQLVFSGVNLSDTIIAVLEVFETIYNKIVPYFSMKKFYEQNNSNLSLIKQSRSDGNNNDSLTGNSNSSTPSVSVADCHRFSAFTMLRILKLLKLLVDSIVKNFELAASLETEDISIDYSKVFSTFIENSLQTMNPVFAGSPDVSSATTSAIIEFNMISDLFSISRDGISMILNIELGEQSEYIVALLQTSITSQTTSLQALMNLINNSNKVHQADNMSQKESSSIENTAEHTSSAKATTSTTVSSKDAMNVALKALVEICPDKGEAYLRAVLQHYKGDVDNSINAIFSGDVPESISRNLDDSVTRVHLGKTSLSRVAFGSSEDEKARNKEFIRNMQRREEEDVRLIQTYADEVSSATTTKSTSAVAISSSSTSTKATKKTVAPSSKSVEDTSENVNSWANEKIDLMEVAHHSSEYNDDYDDQYDHTYSAPSDFNGKRDLHNGIMSQESHSSDLAAYEAGGDDEIDAGDGEIMSQPMLSAPSGTKVTTTSEKRAERRANRTKTQKKEFTEADREARDKEMMEIRRFNSLVKAQESESKFWEDMKVDNRQARWMQEAERTLNRSSNTTDNNISTNNASNSGNNGKGGKTSTQGVNPATSQDSNKKGNKQANADFKKTKGQDDNRPKTAPQQNNSTSNNNSGNKSANDSNNSKNVNSSNNESAREGKHRTKTFDKHHAKDRSMRKQGNLFP